MNDQRHNNLDKISIVILCKDRHKELKQVIDFWSRYQCSTIVLHDTDNPLTFSHYNSNITYINSQEPIVLRLKESTKYISTPYTIIGNDDEIYLIKSVIQLIDFLDYNPNFEAVGGQVIAYNWSGKTLLGCRIYPFLFNYSNNNDDPFNRIYKTLNYKNGMDLTLVYRSDEFKKIVNCVSYFSNYSTPLMYEMMFAFYSSFYCRSIRLNPVYWMRNWYTPFHNNSSWDRNLTWQKWMENPKYVEEVKDWTDKFRNLTTSVTNLNDKQIETLIDNLLNWKDMGNATKFSFMFLNLTPLKKFIKSLIPSYLIRRLKMSIPFTRKKIMPTFESIIEPSENLSKIHDDDLVIFRKFVEDQKSLYS